jgi:hypothetical protein
MDFIETLKRIIQLLPLIMQIIQAMEDAFPKTGAGPAKLAFAKAVINSSAAGKETPLPDAVLDGVISGAVAASNAVGNFKK